MKDCNTPHGECRCSVHHCHARSQQPMILRLLKTLAVVAMITGLSGAAWYCLTSTLDTMTETDCRLGVTRACEALQR